MYNGGKKVDPKFWYERQGRGGNRGEKLTTWRQVRQDVPERKANPRQAHNGDKESQG